MKEQTIQLKKLDPRAVIPTYAHDGDVGMDLIAIDVEYNEEYDYYAYHTGLALAHDTFGGTFIFPRSSNRKKDCYLCNSIGLCDTTIYRGEIIVCFKNRTAFEVRKMMDKFEWNEEDYNYGDYKCNIHPMEFAPYRVGDAVAQLVFAEATKVNFVEVNELNETSRGANGFGSSDTNRT